MASEATLTLYKKSLHGAVYDYVMRFNRKQHCVQDIISIASDCVRLLIEKFHRQDKTIKGRLVARVRYMRVAEEEKEVMYYHPSYHAEVIDDAENFFITHMMKIAQRMEDFNHNSSKLLLSDIPEIHLHVTVLN